MDVSGWWPAALTMIFAGTMVVAMACDVATYQIPDTVSVVLVVTGLVALTIGGPGWSVVAAHGLGALAAFAFGVVMFALGQWGGGDVKFMAATSLWLGWPWLGGYLVVVALAGGILAAAILLFRRCRLPAAWAARAWLARLHCADEGLPYGVALGSGGLVLLHSAIVSVSGG